MDLKDVVYGFIYVPPDIQCILQTKQFQRLKKIRQLGLLPKVLQLDTNGRYEHCLGTYHLAKTMLNKVVLNTSWLNDGSGASLPLQYQRAVEVAALLHDIGHGPFSHTWEHIGKNYHHEENSLPCIDEIFATLSEDCLPELRENNNYGIELVKALILGDPSLLTTPLPKRYGFIFEIVNNKKCKVDVDKLDYLKRDNYYLKKLCDPDLELDDIFLEARASDDGAHIEYRYKDYKKLYGLFEARWMFHNNCYRLPKSMACDVILQDLVKRCNADIEGMRLDEVQADNMSAFLKLHDQTVEQLLKTDADYKYLQDVDKIVEIDKQTAEQNGIRKISIREVIKGPGAEMPNDDNFCFYGNQNEMPQIQRNKEPTEIVAYFELK